MNDDIDVKNLDLDEQAELLSDRVEKSIKDGFGLIFVLYVIKKKGTASTKELRKSFEETFNRHLDYQYTSFYRMIGRMRDEFGLIEEVERKGKMGPQRIYYSLSPLGEILLKKMMDRFVRPLSELVS